MKRRCTWAGIYLDLCRSMATNRRSLRAALNGEKYAEEYGLFWRLMVLQQRMRRRKIFALAVAGEEVA